MTTGRGRGSTSVSMGVIRANPEPDPEITHAPEPVGIRIPVKLENPVTEHLRGYIIANAKTPDLQVVEEHSFVGKTVAICGAGPSLRQETVRGVDRVWACNSALPYLVAQGANVDVGIGIDQTPGLLREWADPPDVTYYVASSCDPYLIAHLIAKGRRVQFFHNHVGCDPAPGEQYETEFDLYNYLYPRMCMVGEGPSVVTRALSLALYWCGFERVDVYGADCSFGKDDVVHANGDSASHAYRNPLLFEATLNGHYFRARPDMLADAVHLARRVKQYPGRVRLMGDTLPVFLMGKSDEFLDLVSKRLTPEQLIEMHAAPVT